MKIATLFPLALAQHVLAQNLQYDTRTTSDCADWVDIDDASVDTCEETRRSFSLTPEVFHAWNPSVGLDCKPWFNYTSYCVATNEEYDNTVYWTTLSGGMQLASLTTDAAGWTIPVTKSGAMTSTASTPTPVPSPESWKEMGCYVDNWNDGENEVREFILDMRYPRDDKETIASCKEKCFHVQYKMAGVKGGDECWCGDRNNGTLAEDQKECNTPCAGDAKTMCGGTQRISVFGAEEDAEGSSGASVSAGTSAGSSTRSAARTSAAGAAATVSSGARRNQAFFGLLG